MKIINISIFLLFLLSFSVFSQINEHIGNIKTVRGSAFIIHNTLQEKASPGKMIFEGDQIVTKQDSGVGIIFVDGTVMTIGENSELFLNKYVFQPVNNQYDFDVFLKKGSGIYNSGRLGKLNPNAVKIRTPKATVGIRGTKFFIKVK